MNRQAVADQLKAMAMAKAQRERDAAKVLAALEAVQEILGVDVDEAAEECVRRRTMPQEVKGV